MQFVLIKLKAPTIDNTVLSMYFYTRHHYVLESIDDTFTILFDGKYYTFSNKYIERFL